jgi:hypothetical protein
VDLGEIIVSILVGVLLALEGFFQRYRMRKLKKKILFDLLTDQRWEWRSIAALSRAIGGESASSTKELLIEIGARESTKERDVWALEQ